LSAGFTYYLRELGTAIVGLERVNPIDSLDFATSFPSSKRAE